MVATYHGISCSRVKDAAVTPRFPQDHSHRWALSFILAFAAVHSRLWVFLLISYLLNIDFSLLNLRQGREEQQERLMNDSFFLIRSVRCYRYYLSNGVFAIHVSLV